MIHHRLRVGLALLVLPFVVAVSGCADKRDPLPDFNAVRFDEAQPIALDVGSIDVDGRYAPPNDPGHMDAGMVLPPAEAARRWARQRLTTAGIGGSAAFVINVATVTEKPLALTDGIRGAFTTEAAYEFTAVIDAQLELRHGGPRPPTTVRATATASRTAREGLTYEQRQRVYFDLVRDLMSSFDTEMSASLQRIAG